MTKPIRVAVVGGGAGGLVAANALLRRGIDVTVYEQAPALGEVGAGVQIAPNSLRLLDRMGLGEGISRHGARLEPGSSYYRMDGTPIAPIQTTDSAGAYSLHGMHRADLITVLSEGLPEHIVRTGHQAVGFEQDADSARVRFANGEVIDADMVLGADGIHSVMREYASPGNAVVHSGSMAYRGLIPADKAPFWPRDISQIWMGHGKHFLVFPVRSGELINYVGFVPTGEQVRESWSATGDPDVLRAEFAGWDPRVEQLLECVESTFWWGLYDREPLPTWGEGRLTLLGDAAHAMLPHLGQGVNQSIEDAVVLATLLSAADHDSVPDVLQRYASIRRARTKIVQEGSRENGIRYDSGYVDLDQRDAEIAASRDFRLWLFDHDAETDAVERMAKA